MNDMMKTTVLSFLLCLAHLSAFSQDSVPFFADEFDEPSTLDTWERFYQVEQWPDMMQHIEIDDGYLIMEPWTCGWYADYHAPFLFQQVSGDFSVTTRIKISGREGRWPTATWSLAGLMVRSARDITPETWQPNGENWIFLTTGLADELGTPVFETKTTRASRSVLELHPAQLDWVELRIVREGSVFQLSYKYNGAEWTPLKSYDRPDLPDVLQVGLNAYTDFYSAPRSLRRDYMTYNTTVVKDGNADLRVTVDWFRISR